MSNSSDETAHMHKVFEAMAETEKLEAQVKAALEGEPEVIEMSVFTGMLENKTI